MTKKEQNIIIFSSIGLIVLIGTGVLLRKRGRLYFSTLAKDLKTWNEEKIKELHPKVRDNARRFIQLAENEGIKVKIFDTNRSLEDQLTAYNKGFSKVTFGYHNIALAMDIYPVKDGWNPDLVNYTDNATLLKLREIGKKAGFETIGDWDRPHYQKTFGYSLAELKTKVANNEFDKDGYLKI